MIQRHKSGGVIIACSRGHGGAVDQEIEKILGPREKEPMSSISCGNNDHEDCGGAGCECKCHK